MTMIALNQASLRQKEYLTAVYTLCSGGAPAKVRDVAWMLGVFPSSATDMLWRLQTNGLIDVNKYKGAAVTPTGERLALNIRERQATIRRFLEALSVSEGTARRDSVRLEHTMSTVVYTRVKSYMAEQQLSDELDPLLATA